jgi:hypothetical protein
MIYFKDIKTETLQIIREIESNNGKSVQHNSSAYGEYAIKPSTAFEYTGVKINYHNQHKVAAKLYDKITEELNTEDPNAVVYAWLKGTTGAKRQLYKPIPYRSIKTHWHVKKYRQKLTEYDKFLIDTNLIFKNWRM